jgi:hypothetical protein
MTDKRKLLDLAFNGGDKNAIKLLTGGFNTIEMERMLQANPETLSNENLEKCLEYLCMKEGKTYKPLNLSTWTNEQLEAELFELDNKLIECEANR